jgi:hypothetical protein
VIELWVCIDDGWAELGERERARWAMPMPPGGDNHGVYITPEGTETRVGNLLRILWGVGCTA